MALPLLIAKKQGRKILKDDYVLGWLMQDDKEGYWTTWGASKNKELALKVAREVVETKGDRDIYITDEPLPEWLTKEQIEKLTKITV